MLKSIHYSLDVIREEARYLIQKGILSRRQPIYNLGQFIPVQDWSYVERELANNEFLLRDCLGDLLGREDWSED